jgi:hypothetical protein
MPETISGEIPEIFTVSGSGISIVTPTAAVIGVILKNSNSQTANALEVKNASGVTYLTVGPDILPGDGTKNMLSITTTFPSVLTGTMSAFSLQVTTAGNSSQVVQGLNLNLLAGYTGNLNSIGINIANFAAGTGNNFVSGAANTSVSAITRGTTTGHNVGVQGIARSGDFNVGVFGRSTTAKASAVNTGVIGIALNTGATSINVAGLFSLINAQPTILTSAALICDNGATTADIFVARDQDSPVFTIADGGQWTLADGININTTGNGTKLPASASQKLGLWGVTPIVQPAGANQAAITDSTGGTAGFTLVDVATVGLADPAKINNNFASLARLVSNIRTALVNSGNMKGAA